MKVINQTKKTTLIENGRLADGFVSRGIGLLSRKDLAPGDGLVIWPCQSVHCFFMRFTIDVLWADKENKIVHMYPQMRPWRISRHVFRAKYVVEVPAGTIAQTKTVLGDTLELIK